MHFCWGTLCDRGGKASLQSEHASLQRGFPCSASICWNVHRHCTGSRILLLPPPCSKASAQPGQVLKKLATEGVTKYNFRQTSVCDICWNGHYRHFYWDSACCTLHISSPQSLSGWTQREHECWTSCWKCSHRVNNASSHRPALPSAHQWHRPKLEGLSCHHMGDLFHSLDFAKGRVWLVLSQFVHFHCFSGLCDDSADIAGGANCVNMLCFNVVPHVSLVCTFIMTVHTIPRARGWIPAHFTRDQVVQNCKSNKKGLILFSDFQRLVSVHPHKVHI